MVCSPRLTEALNVARAGEIDRQPWHRLSIVTDATRNMNLKDVVCEDIVECVDHQMLVVRTHNAEGVKMVNRVTLGEAREETVAFQTLRAPYGQEDDPAPIDVDESALEHTG